MTLDEYLIANKINNSKFSRLLDTGVENVRRWRLNIVKPRDTEMQRIFKVTGGQVDANSFYGINGDAP